MTFIRETKTKRFAVLSCDGIGCGVRMSAPVAGKGDQLLTDLKQLKMRLCAPLRKIAKDSKWQHKPPDTDYCPICANIKGVG